MIRFNVVISELNQDTSLPKTFNSMSAEQPAFNKDKWLVRKMAAASPVWNGHSISKGRYDSVILSTIPLDDDNPAHYRLTSREFDILQLLILGANNKDLARLSGITVGSIRNHIYTISEKFDVYGGRGSLLTKLVESGILRFIPRIQEDDWVGLTQKDGSHRDSSDGISTSGV